MGEHLRVRLPPGGEEDEIEVLERAGQGAFDDDFALSERHTLPDGAVGGKDIQGTDREAALFEDVEQFSSQYPRPADNPDAVGRHAGSLLRPAGGTLPPAHRTGYHRWGVLSAEC